MATFYDRIGENRRNSFLLAAFVVVLLGALGLTIGWAVTGDPRAAIPSTIAAIVIGLLAALGSYYLGDSLVLKVSGATEVTKESAPQLINVVQEMAIASNVPMPRVYLIDDTAPNAFATGRDPKHASVAITTGLLQKLDREELQGVMAHELSHVRNYDIRFSLLVGVLVGSVALLADFFLRFTFWGGGARRRGGDRDSGGAQMVVLVDRPVARGRGAHRGPARPARDQPATRIPRRCIGRRAHPEPRRPRAGAGQDRRRPGGPRGRQSGDAAPVLREPDQEVRAAVLEAVRYASAGPRSGESARDR